VLSLAFPLVAFAQDGGQSAAPPAGPVARIDALNGDVAIQRGDSNDTLAAVQNAPVLAGDYVTTGQGGRAEVGFDGRSAVRLGENVQIRFTSVDPADRQIQLAAGTIELRLFGDGDGQSAIDTPSVSVVPRTAGSFRVSVDESGATAVTVRTGRADIVTPHGNQSLEAGTTVLANGPAANPSIQTQSAIALDAFDSYNGDRDRVYLAATSEGQYVNTNIQGVGDLNGAGNWVDDGTYGHVWIPVNVAPDWAPYRDGNWVWEEGFGWTWVAAEPWGWAPYHYGRWYFSAAYHHWAWFPPAPGRFAPAWSPALVGFVGFNVGAVSAGIGFGNIGWVPLAPFEAFHPWWGPHAAFVNSTTIVNNYVYRNLQVNNALTSVTRENFQNGRFANPTIVSQEQLRSIHPVAVQGALPIVPSQANLRFTQRTPFSAQQASVARVTHVAANGSWSRYNANRNVNGYAQPQYSRPAAPAYQRPAAPAYQRPVAPAYNRAYSRPRAPANNRPARPAAASSHHNNDESRRDR